MWVRREGETRARRGCSWVGVCVLGSIRVWELGQKQRSGGNPKPPALCVRGKKGRGFPGRGPGSQEPGQDREGTSPRMNLAPHCAEEACFNCCGPLASGKRALSWKQVRRPGQRDSDYFLDCQCLQNNSGPIAHPRNSVPSSTLLYLRHDLQLLAAYCRAGFLCELFANSTLPQKK